MMSLRALNLSGDIFFSFFFNACAHNSVINEEMIKVERMITQCKSQPTRTFIILTVPLLFRATDEKAV